MTSNVRLRINKSAIQSPEVLNEAYDYPQKVSFSRGMRVEMDNCIMLFISGTASVDENGKSIHKNDFEAQTLRTLTNIQALLESEDADWHDIVRVNCYLDDFCYYDQFNQVRNNFFDQLGLDPYPASTCIQAQLCRPELLVEIEGIAMIPKDRSI